MSGPDDGLIALLKRRAELLEPDPRLVERALKRCHRWDLRHAGGGEEAGRERRASATVATAPLPPPEDETEGRNAPSPAAVTVPDSEPPQPLGTRIPGSIFRVGDEIAGYRIEGRLGKGGMGDVFRAVQISMGREVAFKVLAKRLTYNESFRNRFMREARSAGRLQHPNLIAVHDVGEADGLLFFSMELVRGRTVGEVLKAEGAYDEEAAVRIIRQVLAALRYAHAHGLIHRDIKPDNVMVTDRGVVKVADLGLARELAESGTAAANDQTGSGTMMGTPYYMAPEQAQDARTADHRADLYSVGATLYHMVVGAVPFRGRTPVEVVVNATTKPLTFPESLGSTKLRRCIAKLMAKEPDDRPADADEALQLLEKAVGQTHTTSGVSARFVERSASGRRGGARRSLATWSVVGGVTVVLLVGAVFVLQRLERQRAWDTLTGAVDRAMADHGYADALERTDAFIVAHPAQEQRAQRLRERVLEDWNAHARDYVDEALETVERMLQSGEYRQARSLLEGIRLNPSLMSPEVSELVSDVEERLRKVQDHALELLHRDVEELLAEGEVAAAYAEAAAFGPPTGDRIKEVIAIQERAARQWDELATDQLRSDLRRIRNSIERGRHDRAGEAIAELRAEHPELMSPAVQTHLAHLEEAVAASGEAATALAPADWPAALRPYLGEGPLPIAVVRDGARFTSSGLAMLPIGEDIVPGTELELEVSVQGEPSWTLVVGPPRDSCFIHINGSRMVVARGVLGEVLRERFDRLEILGQARRAQAQTIALKWKGEQVVVSVPGVLDEAVAVHNDAGAAAFKVHWDCEPKEAVVVRGSRVR